MQLEHNQKFTSNQLTESLMSSTHMFGDVQLPASLTRHSKAKADIESHEELSELNWMKPILDGANVLHIGCSFGLWSSRMAQMSKRVVCYDGSQERATIACEVFDANKQRNATAVSVLDAEDLNLGSVIVVDFRRPMTDDIYRTITDKRPAATIIVIGKCSAEIASRLLRSGYKHRDDYLRAAVFELSGQH
jgi:predicted O-methyltransferase YrrM